MGTGGGQAGDSGALQSRGTGGAGATADGSGGHLDGWPLASLLPRPSQGGPQVTWSPTLGGRVAPPGLALHPHLQGAVLLRRTVRWRDRFGWHCDSQGPGWGWGVGPGWGELMASPPTPQGAAGSPARWPGALLHWAQPPALRAYAEDQAHRSREGRCGLIAWSPRATHSTLAFREETRPPRA